MKHKSCATESERARAMLPDAGKCPHCGRRRGECYVMPCLDLEVALESGVGAVRKWAGQNFIVTLKQPAKGGRARAS